MEIREIDVNITFQNSSFDIDDGKNGNSPMTEQKERIKKYEKDLKKRKELDEQRAREQAFLRSEAFGFKSLIFRASLRGSKKLQSLENNTRRKLELANGGCQNDNSDLAGYSNKCYVTSDISYQENLGNLPSEAIQLEQVIQSANRVANHLENNEKRDEESKFIRDYFAQPDVQKAIEATALQQNAYALNQKASSSSSLTDFGKAEIQGNLKIVKFHKCDDAYLGATVRNEGEKVVIGRIIKGGIADKSHLLREGDELIEANGHDLRGRSVAEVCDILRSISGELSLIVVPSEQSPTDDAKETPVVYQHMRALFDYDPEDDYYVPCKELALKFQRGDILHVINMSDENWWQAYRDGDDPSSSLAGLIPSTAFQRQVILYNRELERESGLSAKRKDLFGCAKKKSSKSRATASNTFFNSADEVVEDGSELLTYESVSLYLSKTGRKRPIVLCGPEGVGCLELRQRLVESDKDKYASAVPCTTRPKMPGEVDGIHFHFVTKLKFQEDAKAGKFIEYGEFQKHLYGTSIAAIQAVVDRAKICLLTLKAENLRALRKTSLMPFVIFIAPPSLQQLRRQKELLGHHGIRDDQLKQILHEGKLMEQTYGHLFDRIMVNIDLDRSLAELKETVHRLETEPQWVPSFWVSGNNSIAVRT
ncbi:unnamed protein product [Enterobius vermicularis]|uniref:MAGUK p55 subfamily member 5 n=1 Tax=Enterobius vermicularis TaxID=51028 RepID=A0A0N4V307_ENTVE|nr:unnamed protein product [Enterobius vermicularis]